jgi:hypothetical protein
VPQRRHCPPEKRRGEKNCESKALKERKAGFSPVSFFVFFSG